MNGKCRRKHVLKPRILMIPSNSPIQFKRLQQFPIRLTITMTINKVQGQSIQICRLNFKNSCFSDGQLYVTYSRVANLEIYSFMQKMVKLRILFTK